MKLYVGIDLHSSNNYVGIINEKNQIVYQGKLQNDARQIGNLLSRFKEEIEGVVVESTFNWYWLVDSLMEEGYQVHLMGIKLNLFLETSSVDLKHL